MSDRLGILGGMFDPVHRGHLAAGRFAIDTLGLDQLNLVPCNIPNHRESLQLSAEHRLKMLELAIRGESDLVIDDCEVRRGGVSYAVDTVSEIRASGSWEQVVFVMGMDAFNGLPRWHRWEALLEACHLFVLGRQAQVVADSVSAALSLPERLVSDPNRLCETRAGQIYIAQDFAVELSSTAVRDRLVAGDTVSELIKPEVFEYICKHGLYGCQAHGH